MCPDCERLQRTPSLTGRHLVHPVDRTRHVVDARGFAICPTCESLWKKLEGKRGWDLVIERPKAPQGKALGAKRAPTKKR